MKINGYTKIKAFDDLLPDSPNTENPEVGENGSLPEAEAALVEIEEFISQNLDDLTDGQYKDLMRIKETLEWQITTAQNYADYPAPGSVNGADPTLWDMPQALDPYWNGIPEDNIIQDAVSKAIVESDPDWFGEYMGTVKVPNSGDPSNPTRVGFQMTDDMVACYGESRGSKLFVTAEIDNGDGTTSLETYAYESNGSEPLIISGIGCNGVQIDFSRVYLPDAKIYIHGSEGHDLIKGAQSSTNIVGYAGDDEIYGGASVDKIYGDEYYEKAGQFDQSYGGHDTINGGGGKDVILGGGGIDTFFTSDSGDSINEYEDMIGNKIDVPGSSSTWSDSGEWQEAEDISENGTIYFRNQSDGSGGEITLDMSEIPGNWDKAFLDMDADNNLVITIGGETGTFTVVYENFFGKQFSTPPKLNIIGSDGNDIINAENVTVDSQVINIKGGAGEDVIIGAKNQMLMDGVDINRLEQSQNVGNAELSTHVNSGTFAEESVDEYKNEDGEIDRTTWNGFTSEVRNNDHIFISGDSSDNVGLLQLKAPDEYTECYMGIAENDDIVIILVNKQASGNAKTIVIKVDNTLGLTYNDIVVGNFSSTTIGADDDANKETMGAPMTPTYISLLDNDYLTMGGTGDDLIITQEGSKVLGDSASEIVWQEILHTQTSDPIEETPTGGGDDGDVAPDGEGGEE